VEDLKAFAEAMKPNMLIPIHTFYAERHNNLFINVKALSDGEALTI